jgi:AraC-like DNA-binding protein
MADQQAGRVGLTFETADPELAVHLLRSSSGDGVRVIPRGQPGRIRADKAPLTGAVRLDQVSLECSFDVQAPDSLCVLLLVHIRSGRASYGSDSHERRYGPGDVCITALPGHPYTARCACYDVAVAIISPAALGRVAATAPGRSPAPVQLTGYEPVSAAAAGQWKAAYAYVRNQILGVPAAAAEPLLVAAAEQLLLATALAAFPNNALADPTIEDRHDAHPATLRRAVAFIEENAHRPITAADIAAAANVTVRAVQLAFRRHLDTTPLAYLRRVRLEHAHQELLAAGPAIETVTAVAYRWGFPSTSRFAAEYRAAYGVLPSRTLRG